jgi:hypothetical protein
MERSPETEPGLTAISKEINIQGNNAWLREGLSNGMTQEEAEQLLEADIAAAVVPSVPVQVNVKSCYL